MRLMPKPPTNPACLGRHQSTGRCSTTVVHLICNEQVGGSTPVAGPILHLAYGLGEDPKPVTGPTQFRGAKRWQI